MKYATPVILVILLCSTSSTLAGPIGVAAGFNVLTFGDFTSSNSDTEGRLAVGGNAVLVNYGIGALLPMEFTGNGLVVGGNLNFNSGQVSQGNIAYGGVANLVSVGIPNGISFQGTPLDFSAAQVDLQNRSAAFSQAATNGVVTNMFGQLEFEGTNADVNVFGVSAAELASATNVVIDVPAGSTVLINADGMAVELSGFAFNSPGGGALPIGADRILFNFFEATTAEISAISVPGSILAPFADLEFNNGQINGTVVVQSVAGGGQFNSVPFAGNLPFGNVQQVPEPSTLAMLICGMLWLGAKRYGSHSKRMR